MTHIAMLKVFVNSCHRHAYAVFSLVVELKISKICQSRDCQYRDKSWLRYWRSRDWPVAVLTAWRESLP